MLIPLLTYVVDTVVPESQCGFRRARRTTDMIFVARLIQEKCREQHRDLFIAFIHLTKAFDTVNRDLLWRVLRKFGCPPHFFSILREFHAGTSARVVQGREMSKNFAVNTGVKQGCVLVPVIFNLFLVAVTFVFRHNISAADGVRIKYRLDGSLFSIRRLQAVTKVTNDTIFDLRRRRRCPAHPHTRRPAATAGCNLFSIVSSVEINLDSLNSSLTWEHRYLSGRSRWWHFGATAPQTSVASLCHKCAPFWCTCL